MRKKKKFIIYSDIHKYAPQFTGHTVDEMIAEHNQHMADGDKVKVVLTGDIIDVKNCKRWSELEDARYDVLRLETVFGRRYSKGNHERDPLEFYFTVIDGVLFTHGHKFFWRESKIQENENKKQGLTKFRYYRYQAYKKFRKRKNNKRLKPSEKHLELIKDYMIYYNCHTVVFGHSHRNYDVTYPWGRVINIGQGRTELDL